eukprot:CAMPEP_0177259122 /NCGR_PEP_ID=MMETSP0367-20130122/58473_1 /TAXON_ID=447022 ORGANISM="Scrippsiella hangoei-like, Strain SHHI-4" /NCGR_SAMPLE_ID=MMETSP0367 /ASSEMBLY_ACC=CAM_ASM_000362 /LENGTH=52 /DNA_ID=CAMNT_0018713385 /DNA_START=85 /DNA_END=239 /DNA_ORIENTATION=+
MPLLPPSSSNWNGEDARDTSKSPFEPCDATTNCAFGNLSSMAARADTKLGFP